MLYIFNKFKTITLNNKIFKTYFLLKIKKLMDIKAQKGLQINIFTHFCAFILRGTTKPKKRCQGSIHLAMPNISFIPTQSSQVVSSKYHTRRG